MKEDDQIYSDNQVVADLAIAGSGKQQVDQTPFVIVPAGYQVEDLSQFLARPARKTGTVDFDRAGDFNAYVNKHKRSDATIILADWTVPYILATLDHHESDGANWREHQARCTPPLDPDWQAWNNANDKAMKQADFAQFIENQLPNIAKPDGAEVLEVAQHLEATTRVKFKSAERLANGNRQMHYSEDTEGKVGSGTVEIPAQLELALPVFRWGELHKQVARLRYRISDQGLLLWVHLDRPHDTLDTAFQALLGAVVVETKLAVWRGR